MKKQKRRIISKRVRPDRTPGQKPRLHLQMDFMILRLEHALLDLKNWRDLQHYDQSIEAEWAKLFRSANSLRKDIRMLREKTLPPANVIYKEPAEDGSDG